MANITRFDPFNEIVDDFFKGFFVRPVAYGRGEATGYSYGAPRLNLRWSRR